ncbi:hypothetical protein ACFQMA_13835 [Halosimplex aquaticum]|uniref:Flagellin N-terminal-like domain-containing protein n=1 Tax=Halosimplex aquaticum TaxID=3026162 RepID=A0ABD5Y574_9EURY|nr:hypothetical protein [Halosimplex aquaticum]
MDDDHGQSGLVGSAATNTSETTASNLESLGYGVTDDAEPDGSAGSPTHIAIKIFAFVGTALLLALFLLGSGLF